MQRRVTSESTAPAGFGMSENHACDARMHQSHRIHYAWLMREKRVASCEQVGHRTIHWARCISSADGWQLVAAALDAGALWDRAGDLRVSPVLWRVRTARN
jgi:hypothetical protein